MAVIWRAERGGSSYEVRSAGATRRLYTDGIFHSQFNPDSPLTGAVWDLLMLPAFLFPPQRIQRVLVLGVGGGAVIRQLETFLKPRHVTGIDIDPVHLDVARQHFGVTGKNIRLLAADAIEWVHAAETGKYDLVIDDLFGRGPAGPLRAIKPTVEWCWQLARVTSASGGVVMNCLAPRDLRHSGFMTDAGLRQRFASRMLLRSPVDENAVGAFLPFAVEARELRQNLKCVPGLNTAGARKAMRFSIQALADA
ncbi:MAG: methyltransferase domain-containing protein [Gammaproteobacteria bacterium]|nr:methyltransferase domain-containing protein [Gammaproteobacteria bacterium]